MCNHTQQCTITYKVLNGLLQVRHDNNFYTDYYSKTVLQQWKLTTITLISMHLATGNYYGQYITATCYINAIINVSIQ